MVLAGGIAHDFNNLLVAIMGHAELALADMSYAAFGREHVEEISRAARRAADLTNQMLAYSGKGLFVVESIDLNEIVPDMGHLLQASISKRITLRYDLAPTLPPVEGDVAQVQQVVMNLVTNASEAIGDDSGVVVIRTTLQEVDAATLSGGVTGDDLPAGAYVVLEVSDTGSGMDEGTRDRLSDPFFTTELTGRGLGLAAALGIVRGHHGALEVHGELGRGSRFRVMLPAAEGEVQHLDAEEEIPLEPWRGEGVILVVDDEPSMRMITEEVLGRHGFEVLTASDGAEGVPLGDGTTDDAPPGAGTTRMAPAHIDTRLRALKQGPRAVAPVAPAGRVPAGRRGSGGDRGRGRDARARCHEPRRPWTTFDAIGGSPAEPPRSAPRLPDR